MTLSRAVLVATLMLPALTGGCGKDKPAPAPAPGTAIEQQASQAAPAGPSTPPSAPPSVERFRAVKSWQIEVSVRSDDHFQWETGRGQFRYNRSLAESLVASIQADQLGSNPEWHGQGDGEITHQLTLITDGITGHHGDTQRNASGRRRCDAFFDIDEKRGTYTWAVSPTTDAKPFDGMQVATSTDRGQPPRDLSGPYQIHCVPTFTTWYSTRHRLPDRGLILSGSMPFPVDQYFKDNPGADPKEHHIQYPWSGTLTWRITPIGSDKVDLVIDPPADYDSWLPIAGATEKIAGSRLDVTAHLVTRDGKPSTREARKFVFELDRVSHEPGICMNAPRDGGTTDPDLAFEPGVSRLKVTDPLSTRGETAGDGLIAATATVSCFDYGASADLKVTALMDDGEWITGYVRGDRSRSALAIPKRDTGSKIASAWKQWMKAERLPDEDDGENDPVGDGFQGDGLTLYEEYRGFMDAHGYRRMDPRKKELFVCDELKDGTEAAFTRFQKISGFTVRTMTSDQHRDRVINFNHSGEAPHRCDQHLIILQPPRSALDMATEFTGGFTFRLSDNRKATTPRSVDRIVVKTKDESVPAVGHDLAPQTASYREIVIVHEMLHAVNVPHHGEGDVLAGVEWSRQETPPTVLENGKPIQVFRESVSPVPLKSFDETFDQPFKLVLAIQNGAFSGDQACIMRYAGADAYVFPNNRSTRRIYIAHESPEAWGLELCSSPDGTGVNAPGRNPNPRYGRAGKGRCAQQLRVCDADP